MSLEHLLPSVREIVSLPVEERISKLDVDFWIGYDLAETALSKLEALLGGAKRVRMPNLLIISPTNNGKTTIIERFKLQHLPYESLDKSHEISPVVVVQAPTDASLKSFYAELIEALGSPVRSYRATFKYEKMAVHLLKVAQTKLLIVDEIHNVLVGNMRQQREFLNVLRYLGNRLRISIAGIGTKEAYHVIRNDPQLENRFAPLILPPWQDGEEFMRLLDSFQQILPLKKESDLLNAEVRMLILTRTEGALGEIATFLTEAAKLAIRSGQEYINKAVLLQTHYYSPTERCRMYESELQK